MKSDGIAALNQFETSDFVHWLIDGAERMVGVRDGIDAAFAPVADHVGGSRDRTWVEDIAWGVHLALDQSAGHRLRSALELAMRRVAPQVTDDTWRVMLHLLELTRMLQIERRADGVAELAARLGGDPFALRADRRRALVAAALLALCESQGEDRRGAASVALDLARQLQGMTPPLTAAQQAVVRRRLLALPGVDDAALASIGLGAASGARSDRPSAFHGGRLVYG